MAYRGNGCDRFGFFSSFKVHFRGKSFDFEWSPSAVVPNSVYVKSIIILFVIFCMKILGQVLQQC